MIVFFISFDIVDLQICETYLVFYLATIDYLRHNFTQNNYAFGLWYIWPTKLHFAQSHGIDQSHSLLHLTLKEIEVKGLLRQGDMKFDR